MYLEKYVTHSTITISKLDELSFKNFKLSLKRDIAQSECPNSEKEEHRVTFENILRGIRGIENIDSVFTLLTHSLKDKSNVFSDDIKANPALKGKI